MSRYIIFSISNRAGALSLVLGISIIVATLCMSMIYLAYFHRLSQIHDSSQLAINRRIESGINYLLSNIDELQSDKTYQLDLFENGKDSVSFKLKPWGLFQIANVYASQGKLSSERIAMVGNYPGLVGLSALYLADKSRPLSVGGATRIIGDAFLPKSGIKKVVVDKLPYDGRQLIYGKASYSRNNLPMLNDVLLDNLLKSMASNSNPDEMDPTDQQSHGFSEASTRHFFLPHEEVISGKFQGNIVIHSNRKIIIARDARLEDVIIEAPFVSIENGFTGCIQIIARDTILVGDNVRLKYPSALVILKDEGKSLIKLQRRCQVEGLIVVDGKANRLHDRYLHMEPESELTGMAYADAMVIMKGNIRGHLSCSKLLHASSSSLYENHIINARIERNLLPNAFVGADMWGDSGARGIVKWLE